MSSTILFANKIKQLRKIQGLPQRKIAATFNVDAGFYNKIERSKRLVRQSQVIALALLFDCVEK